MLLHAKLEQQLASKDVRICNLSQELAAAKIELTKSIAAFLGASRLRFVVLPVCSDVCSADSR